MSQIFRVLLVEDNPADAYLFRMALERAQIQVELIVIDDGADALAFVRGEGPHTGREAPHLAVLDLNVPKHEGTEVLAAIRENSDFAKVPVVISSSSAEQGGPGAQFPQVERYIRKPADLEEFLRIGTILKEVLLRRDGSSFPPEP
jgi:CheY-like chemotaxis protein